MTTRVEYSHFGINFKMLRITQVLCLIALVSGQVPNIGRCPQVRTIPTFDVQRYYGEWYEQARFYTLFEFGGKCVTANYSSGANGTVKVINSQISSITGRPSSIEGTARIVNASEPGKLAVKFPLQPVEGAYWILGTDYTTYAAVWACKDFFIFNMQFAWILTRQQNASAATIDQAKHVFAANNVTIELFEKTNQADCPSKSGAS